MANPIHIGLSGLKAASRGIATTSHNIANATTEGYSRQRNINSTTDPYLTKIGYQGSGVATTSIERVKDTYINAQLQSHRSELGRVSNYQALSERIETLLAGSNLDQAQTQFFNALEDAANNPHLVAQSDNVIAASKNISSQYNYLDTQLQSLRNDINNSIDAEVQEINALSEEVYLLNKQISTASANSSVSPPNDLLDRRDLLIEKLSEHISVSVTSRGERSVDVSTGNGIPLVSIAGAHKLSTMASNSDPLTRTVALDTDTGPKEVSTLLSGGKLGALIEFQQQSLEPTRRLIGRSAMVLAENINQAFQSGLGDPDAVLFGYTAIETYSNAQNTGNAEATATLIDPSLMTGSDYSLQFDGAQYTLTRLDDNNSIQGTGNLSMDGMQISVSTGAVAGDTYLIRPTTGAASTLAVSEVNAHDLTKLSQGANPIPVVQSMAELRNTMMFEGQTENLSDQFSGLLIRVGSASRTATSQLESMQNIYNDTVARKENISGVSLDEEAAALLMYQRNYDAAARAIAISNSLFDTLIATMNRI